MVFKELAQKGARSAKGDTSGATPKPGDKTTPLAQTPCDDNGVAGAPGQGDVVVDEPHAGVTSDVVVDAYETNDELEASSTGAAPSCYSGSRLREAVTLMGNTFDSETGSFDLTDLWSGIHLLLEREPCHRDDVH